MIMWSRSKGLFRIGKAKNQQSIDSSSVHTRRHSGFNTWYWQVYNINLVKAGGQSSWSHISWQWQRLPVPLWRRCQVAKTNAFMAADSGSTTQNVIKLIFKYVNPAKASHKTWLLYSIRCDSSFWLKNNSVAQK